MKNRYFKRSKQLAGIILVSALLVTGCGSTGDSGNADSSKSDVQQESNETEAESQETVGKSADDFKVVDREHGGEIEGLTYQSSLKTDYAKCFQVHYYEGGYKLLNVPESGQYLLIPEGTDVPKGLSKEITVIRTPLKNVYLAATSAMALFDAIGADDVITMTGTDTNGWSIEAPKKALTDGRLQFAGKYNAPDYERMVANSCDLAIESTMILHAPEVKEMIEDLDIPVFIDRSSYESEALGRSEWIKLYGALTDKEAEACKYFEEQEKVITKLADFENTGKTVAFFSVNSDGSVVVRTSGDYISNMIAVGGGKYIFEDLENKESNASTVTISMEEFYSKAVNADYLVYNATIEEKLGSVKDLIAQNGLFKDFEAVKDDQVWQVDKKMYQSTDKVGQLIEDFNHMFTDEDESQMTFLSKVAK